MSPDSRWNRWFIQSLARGSASFAIALGIGIVVVDDRRFGGPAFQPMLQVGGSQDVWGWFLVAAGLVALLGSLLHKLVPLYVGLLAITLWSMFLAGTFVSAFIHDDRAAITGCFAYSWLAFLNALLTAAHGRRWA